MENFFQIATSAGVASIVTAVLLQPSFANEADHQVKPAKIGAVCSAKVGPARFTVGDRCFRDEVMVGRWDDNIYCANIEIICD
jgi:hypothetical protein